LSVLRDWRQARAAVLLPVRSATAGPTLRLGHESIETTHIYVEADLVTKEAALNKLAPPKTAVRRFKPNDALLAFLAGL
jgi:hypothetical protein